MIIPKILLWLLLTFPLTGNSQVTNIYQVYPNDSISTEYPKYLINTSDSSKIDTIGVVMTVEQAQKIDNDLELLYLYRTMHISCDTSINYLIKVVDDYKHLNFLAEVKFQQYDIVINDQKSQIANLKSQIANKALELNNRDETIVKKDQLIDIDLKQIRHLKRQKTGLIIGGVSVSFGLIYMIIGHPGIK